MVSKSRIKQNVLKRCSQNDSEKLFRNYLILQSITYIGFIQIIYNQNDSKLYLRLIYKSYFRHLNPLYSNVFRRNKSVYNLNPILKLGANIQ